MIYIIATLTIKPGTREDVLKGALPCIEATRREAGCISYDLNHSMTDENTLVFVERWKDHDAIKDHFEAPHMAVWRELGVNYITDRKIEIITPEKVKEL